MKRHNLKYKSDEGMTTDTPDIISAALDGNSELVDTLLEQGEDINTVDPVKGFTCLHIACMQGHRALLDVLVKHHKEHGDLDFTIRAIDPPRLAWQMAMNFHHYDIANEVDALANTRPAVPPRGQTPQPL